MSSIKALLVRVYLLEQLSEVMEKMHYNQESDRIGQSNRMQIPEIHPHMEG